MKLYRLVAASVLLVLSGCASTPDVGPTTLSETPASTSTSSSNVVNPPSVEPETAAPASSAESSLPSQSADTADTAVTSTAADEQIGQAALAAYLALWKVNDESLTAPDAKTDWSADVYAVTTGEYAQSLLDYIDELRTSGVRQVGSSDASGTVTAVAGETVTIAGCVAGHVQFVDPAGAVVSDEPGGWTQTATVERRDGVFLVVAVEFPTEDPGC